MQETGPTVYRPYPRRLADVIAKAAYSLGYFETLSTCLSGLGLEPETSRSPTLYQLKLCKQTIFFFNSKGKMPFYSFTQVNE